MAILKRVLIRLVVGTILVAMLAPLGAYGLGLYGIEAMPQPPKTIATASAQAAVWNQARGVGPVVVPRLNPYTYWHFSTGVEREKAGLLIAWGVAAAHLKEQQRYKGMHWWHLSGAALTIWLTRHWSVEQILSKASENAA
jgi:hypothetical protein